MHYTEGPAIVILDFHGFTLEQVQECFEAKLAGAYAHNQLIVRIIHGQGKHSEFFPVLKSYIRHWLEDSDFSKEKIETVFRGEDGSPYTSPNPGETIVVFKGGGSQSLAESEISWEEEERYEARRNAKRIRSIQKGPHSKRSWR